MCVVDTIIVFLAFLLRKSYQETHSLVFFFLIENIPNTFV